MGNGSARKKLNAWKAEHGLSSYRLAKLLQVSRSGLSKVLIHGSQPTLPLAAKIEAATGGAVRLEDWLTSNQRRSVTRAKNRVRQEVEDLPGAAA